MGAPTSFSSRRPNASNLPNFELPPPQLTSLHQKYHSYATASQPTPSIPSSLTSVGNLLTPPSGISSDGLSPNSNNMPSANSQANHSVPPFTPTGYMWPPSHTGTTPYGFHSSNSPNSRGLFSPSLNSIVKGTNSPHSSEHLPPPNFPENPFPTSMSMSAPVNLPALPSQASNIGSAMMGGHATPVTQASPATHHDSYARPPPTPTYFNGSQQSNHGQQPSYGYSSGPSPIQQSPMSAGGQIPRMSPANGHGPIAPLQPQNAQSPYAHQRSYQYSLPGPVLSNVGNPNNQLALVGGMPPSMMPAYNSGHAAHMQHMYGHPQAQPNPQNDRPFKCDQCPQSFNRNHDLKRHKRIHLAVKPFPCGHCDKSFSRKDALKVRLSVNSSSHEYLLTRHQRHILVKGCGKASTNSAEGDRKDGSISPAMKSENSSPAVSASA